MLQVSGKRLAKESWRGGKRWKNSGGGGEGKWLMAHRSNLFERKVDENY